MTKKESLSNSLAKSVVNLFLKLVFLFEPLAPTAITVLVNQWLDRFEKTGSISGYKTKTKRLGKFHYLIQIDVDVTGIQALHLSSLFPNQLSIFRRWFND